MRRAVKDPQSKVLAKNMKYVKGNSANNLKIAEELLIEQKGFCAYTDECITRTDARDIEHFNPTLKYTENDGYNNWFAVSISKIKRKVASRQSFSLFFIQLHRILKKELSTGKETILQR